LWFEVLWDKTPISTNKMDIVENTCHPSYVVSIIRKISVLTSPDKNMKPYLKNKAKRGGGVAQEFKHQHQSKKESQPTKREDIYKSYT
jgi:hypothetical protein